MAIGGSLSVGLIGLKAFIIQIQAFISPGLPYFSVIGLPDASLSESRERVKSACQASGFKWPDTRVTVNMSPASMPKRGASHDLAIAAGVLSAAGAIPHDSLEETIVLGEVNLDGTVLPIHGLLPIMLHAKERGIRRLIVPYGNEDESRLVPQMDVTCVRHVGELIELAGGRASYTLGVDRATVSCTVEDTPAFSGLGDMSEVVGQDHVKWALQVAAAGKHHLLMTGPPGSGKTMLASRMPSIMCPLTPEEQLEVASIRSLCGTLQHYGISDMPPFEAPHHTASTASLVGGGSGLAMPGRLRAPTAGSCSWTRPLNSPRGRCRRCASRWNPGTWPCLARRGRPTIRRCSRWSWQPTRARAVTPTATGSAACARRRTVSGISPDYPVRFSTGSTFRWRCRRSRA